MTQRRFTVEQIIGKLREAVADLTLDKLILKEAASGNFRAPIVVGVASYLCKKHSGSLNAVLAASWARSGTP